MRSRWVASASSPTLRISTGASASSTKSFTPTIVRRPCSSSAWNRMDECGDLALEPAGLDRLHHAALGLDLGEQSLGLALQPVGQRLQVVRPAQRVGHVGHPGLVGEDLLGPERDADRFLGGQRQGLVQRVGVERLGAAQHRGQRLVRHPGHVVVRLLRGQRHPGRLAVEPHLPAARVPRAVALAHVPGPDPARGPELGDLLEEVVVDVPEEGEPGREAVHVEARGPGRARRSRSRWPG